MTVTTRVPGWNSDLAWGKTEEEGTTAGESKPQLSGNSITETIVVTRLTAL
jgi:hypothetical protein